ncbi:hypothetical protein [Hymenobacter fodinae]|nr:hypothetical protein [Hymenobacter fodinae]
MIRSFYQDQPDQKIVRIIRKIVSFGAELLISLEIIHTPKPV